MALADDCDTDRLTDLIQSKVQGAEVIRHHGKEMAFSLPMEQLSAFPGIVLGSDIQESILIISPV